ncbi:TM1266 family iron-only hydrogenase system putative regulator, partial [Dysosmobacter welbionis]
LGHLENQGSLQIPGGLGDALDDLHIVDVERADGIAAVVGFFEHFGRGNQCHKINSCSFICPALPHRPTGPIPVVKKRRFKRTKTIFPYD